MEFLQNGPLMAMIGAIGGAVSTGLWNFINGRSDARRSTGDVSKSFAEAAEKIVAMYRADLEKERTEREEERREMESLRAEMGHLREEIALLRATLEDHKIPVPKPRRMQ